MQLKTYDYLVVGAGLFGAVFAHEAAARGRKCLVIDKRDHPGGNVYCDVIEGIHVHTYGAHIFHTGKEHIWRYVNRFVTFNHYVNSPIANYNGEIYNLPFNMNTFNKLWGVVTPDEAQRKIAGQIARLGIETPRNLEEQALMLVGPDIYEKLIKGYTEKQWGRPCDQLPAFIIRRLPVRYTYDNNYFNDPHQGIPKEGYNTLVEKLLDGVETRLGVDFLEDRQALQAQAETVVYTGMVDAFYGYRFGELEYRSLRFETQVLPTSNYQGNAVVNYTDAETPYTRIIEHKHFLFGEQESTVVTREYPAGWERGTEAYYPVGDERNKALYARYQALAEQEPHVLFGGRLAEYRYYNMDQVIESALEMVKRVFGENASAVKP
ncbi:UDP-galactopyranose mutase [Ethanoligenens harbinense]|uniref:UDP-galactopyranose mutase n=1 Tax=Ethanoligenens harbinense TaxID=253239 RepID=UPI00032239A0|nr:UDP-galactopyranose mutase [Ethanoligenens harbinense]